MKTFDRMMFAAACLALSATAMAQTTVGEAWIRGTVAQQKTTGLFAQITSKEGGQLTSVSSPVAGVVEIHEMAMEGNVMKMRALPQGLALPAGKVVSLAPGGYHVMLMDLKQPLKAGDKVPVSFVIRAQGKSEVLKLEVEVRPMGAPAMDHGAHGGHGSDHSH